MWATPGLGHQKGQVMEHSTPAGGGASGAAGDEPSGVTPDGVSGCAPDAEPDGSPDAATARRDREQEHEDEREKSCRHEKGKKEGQLLGCPSLSDWIYSPLRADL